LWHIKGKSGDVVGDKSNGKSGADNEGDYARYDKMRKANAVVLDIAKEENILCQR
jgi:hypothetical protein